MAQDWNIHFDYKIYFAQMKKLLFRVVTHVNSTELPDSATTVTYTTFMETLKFLGKIYLVDKR